jgi:hypothetical protein
MGGKWVSGWLAVDAKALKAIHFVDAFVVVLVTTCPMI